MNEEQLIILYRLFNRYFSCDINTPGKNRHISERKQLFAYIAVRQGATLDSITHIITTWKRPNSVFNGLSQMKILINTYPIYNIMANQLESMFLLKINKLNNSDQTKTSIMTDKEIDKLLEQVEKSAKNSRGAK